MPQRNPQMTPKDPERIFVVGCARSGTTLLQAMLSSHPAVLGFPETFYFAHSRTSRKHQGISRWWRNRRQSIYALQDALQRLQMSDQFSPALHLASPKQIDKYFLSLLDSETRNRGKSVWSEKTPGHVNFIPNIRIACPEAKFIHVLRDGRDVVASLEDLHRNAPPERRGRTWDLNNSIKQWNHCLEIAARYKNEPQHHLLSYEKLVESSDIELAKLCDFVNLPFQKGMLDHQSASEQILGNDAENGWRRDVLQPIKNTHLIKYHQLFSKEDQLEIESRLNHGGIFRRMNLAV